MVGSDIAQKLKDVVTSLFQVDIKPVVTEPKDSSFGDYASNIALVLAKQLGKNPREIAEKIVTELTANSSELTVKVEGPGFVNFWISKEDLLKTLQKSLDERDTFGNSQKLAGEKIMVEFGDPNPFKEFHIGHLLSIVLGESYSRLLEAAGANVYRVSYQGDVGLHVAKALWGMQKLQDQKPDENAPLEEKVKFLGTAYVVGAKAYERGEANEKEEIRSINIKLYKHDESLKADWEQGRAWSLAYFEEIYRRVGTDYKHSYFESATSDFGRDLVRKNVPNGVFEASQGALVFRGENYGLHTRVFVTKEDYATYEGKDLALPFLKKEDFDYERSIIITAHEQAPYFEVVLAALKKIAPELAEKTKHFSHGFVRLKEGKMASRTGNVIAGTWLLDQAKKEIMTKYPDLDKDSAEIVAVGAVKYSMLKITRGSDIAFSFEESVSLEGNSGPYIQYTFVRSQSILKKAGSGRQVAGGRFEPRATSHELQAEEESLLRTIIHFPEIVEKAAEEFMPNTLSTYLFDLAQKFNLFYQKQKIIGTESEDFKLQLTASVGNVLKRGLYLLGIESPEKM